MLSSDVEGKSLTLVAGYLGAGKTTLVNRILGNRSLRRTAVVVNDFGSVNIDAALIADSGADTIELTNGCICCQIGDNVQRTMSALAERSDIDCVICEVSGVGDPAQLRAWSTYPGFRPGGVLVCVDAVATVERLHDEYVADVVAAQIRAASLLAVTKTDVANGEQVSLLRERCAGIAGEVPMFMTAMREDHGSCSDEFVSMMRAIMAFDIGRRDQSERREKYEPGSTSQVRSHHVATHRSLTVTLPGRVDIESVGHVLTNHVARLVRAKGIVLSTSGEYEVIQLASNIVRIATAPTGQIGSMESYIVLIGAGPKADEELRLAAMDLRGLCDA
ncbi:MAG: GTP-binding protein [Actinomycetia bacterium]|nr:GTP-binding protein [Actinomycetes bacterium]